MGKRKRHSNISWEDLPPELLHRVAMQSRFWASEPMRGVCNTWRAAVQTIPRPSLPQLLLPHHSVLTEFYRRAKPVRSPEIYRVLAGNLSVGDTYLLYQERLERVAVLGEVCVLTALPPERVAEINPCVVSKSKVFKMFNTTDAMQRTLRHAGGVWTLLARRHRREQHLSLKPVHIERSKEHARSIRILNETLKYTDGFSDVQKKRMLAIAKTVP